MPFPTTSAAAAVAATQDLKYHGTTPATKSKASQIIKNIRLHKRVQYLKEKARRKGTPAALIDKMVAMVKKHGL